jgi:Cu2+-exporting ATPase
VNQNLLKKERRQGNAGAINGNGSLKIKVTHNAKDSYLSQVIKLVQDAQKSKSKTQLLADKAAQWLTSIAIVAGMVTFLYWYVDGKELAFAIETDGDCNCDLLSSCFGFSCSIGVAKSPALSAQNGLLIKNRTVFENSRKVYNHCI